MVPFIHNAYHFGVVFNVTFLFVTRCARHRLNLGGGREGTLVRGLAVAAMKSGCKGREPNSLEEDAAFEARLASRIRKVWAGARGFEEGVKLSKMIEERRR